MPRNLGDLSRGLTSASLFGMRSRSVRFIQALLLMLCFGVLADCSGRQRPFRMVQFCLSGPEDLALFKQVANRAAQGNRMEFTDRSAQTEAEEEAIAQSAPQTSVAHPTVNISADHGGKFNFGAANFAEAPYQIVVGFNGSDPTLARMFSDGFVRMISQHWQVHEVEHPDQTGASPLKQCQ